MLLALTFASVECAASRSGGARPCRG